MGDQGIGFVSRHEQFIVFLTTTSIPALYPMDDRSSSKGGRKGPLTTHLHIVPKIGLHEDASAISHKFPWCFKFQQLI
jgi:hypothetical protein